MTKATANGPRRKPGKTESKSCEDSGHPDHAYAIPRLRRVQGQLAGIDAMIRSRRYCADILIQFRAAIAALRGLEAMVFETHLRHCVRHALDSKDPRETEKKIQELTELISKR